MKKSTIAFGVIILLFLLPLRSFSTIIYVKQGGSGTGTSWNNAYGSLQDAVTNAAQGDEIWIAEGTYKPSATGDRWARFQMKPGLKLYGGFNGTETAKNQRDSSLTIKKTVLSGELQNDGIDSNNSANIIQVMDISSPVIINSLILEKTYSSDNIVANNSAINIDGSVVYVGNIEISAIQGSWAGAIAIHESRVYINKANIHNNKAVTFGGGIMIDYSAGVRDPIYVNIKNTTIDHNSGDIGGGLYSKLGQGDTLIFENGKVNNNTGGMIGGGGLFMEGQGAFVSLSKVEIRSNHVTGIWNGGGGIFMVYGDLIANDLLVADNTIAGEEGGGLFLQQMNSAKFTNCTFANNKAGNFPGNQFYLVTSNAVAFRNCIIDTVGKGLADFAPWWGWEYSTGVTFTNCLFGGSFPDFWIDGGNNITNTNPGFRSASNYALSDTSPAIDAGNNALRSVSYTDDLAGNTRIYNGVVDIGAFEFIPEDDTTTAINGPGPLSGIVLYPNPAIQSIIIEGAAKGISYEVYNAAGQCLLQSIIQQEKQPVNISALSSGIYIIRLQDKEGRQGHVKFVKR